MKKLFVLSPILFLASILSAQIEDHDIDIFKEMAREDQEIISALTLYPKEIRELIFEASTHPETLIKLANVQNRTSGQFKSLMQNQPEEVQRKAWEMTRYPGLIDKLVKEPGNDDAIIGQYPADVQETAKSMVKTNLSLLQEIARLDALSQSTFARIVGELPENDRATFNELIKYPEILDLLNQNIELTILGGDLYKKDPELVRRHADSLNLVYSRQHALELEDWRNKLENDPEAVSELKEATAEFAKEYGFDESEITQNQEQQVVDDLYYDDEEYDYDEPQTRVVEHHYYHYPYWFGYPYWYSYPYWRPYPFWYECGYYWNPYGAIVVYHMPSPFFMHWYFYRPYHHYRYTHLSNHFVNHYYGHRSSGSSITGAVKSWRTTNREVVSDDWLADESKRVPALREFGKMEDARIAFNEKNPKTTLTKKEFVEKNQKSYPYLSSAVRQTEPGKVTQPEKPDVQKPPVTREKPDVQKPPVTREKPDVQKPPVTREKEPVVKPPRTETQPVPQPPVRKERPIIRLKKAEDFHKQNWEQSTRPRQPTVRPNISPSRTTPSTPPRQQTPRKRDN